MALKRSASTSGLNPSVAESVDSNVGSKVSDEPPAVLSTSVEPKKKRSKWGPPIVPLEDQVSQPTTIEKQDNQVHDLLLPIDANANNEI